MSFTVPATMPVQPVIQSPQWIKAKQLQQAIETDRYVFATRRRVFWSQAPAKTVSGALDLGVTSIRCSLQSAGSLTIYAVGDGVDVKITVAGVGTATASIPGAGSDSAVLTGLTPGIWYDVGIQASQTGTGTLTIVELFETLLTAADL